jgi:outer membrane protein assembly factor BamB
MIRAILSPAVIRRGRVFPGAVLLLVCLVLPVEAAWPTFMHDAQRRGRADTPVVSGPVLAWRSAIGPTVFAGPAVTGESAILCGGFQGVLYARSPDGAQQWGVTLDGEIDVVPALLPDGPIALPAADGKLYLLSADGAMLWSATTGGSIRRSSPLIDPAREAIYFGSLDFKLYSYDFAGGLRWVFETDGPIWSSPSLVAESGDVLFGSDDERLRRLRPDGSPVWTANLGAALRSAPALTDDGRIVIGAADGDVICLDMDGRELWRIDFGGEIDGSSPAIDAAGNAYIGSTVGLHAVSPAGEELWSFQDGTPFRSPPVVDAEGRVIAASDEGTLYAFGDGGTILWELDLGQRTLSAPAIDEAGRVLLAGLDGDLIAVGPASPTPTATPLPTLTPSPTATPVRNAPRIRVAGFLESSIDTTGGVLQIFAWVHDPDGDEITSVEVYYDGLPTGLRLPRSTADPEIFLLPSTPVGPGLIAGYYPIQLAATDATGARSVLWPALVIEPAGGNASAPPGRAAPRLEALRTFQQRAAAAIGAGAGEAPVVLCAGFMDTALVEGSPGELTILAAVADPQGLQDIARVEVLYEMQPVGLTLGDDGAAGDDTPGDGLFTFRTTTLIPEGTAGTYELQIRAVDRAGNSSSPWPFLAVVEAGAAR